MKIKPELIDTRTGKHFRVFKNPTIIGRHRSCEICFPIVEVSRRHCAISEENDTYYIEDLKSVNGTFLNEEAISGRRRLEDGCHIKISKCTKYPAGAKVLVFRHPQPKPKPAVEEKPSDSEKKDVGEFLPKTKLPLKHCVFRITKKSVLGSEARARVPLQKLTAKEVHFLGLVAHRPGDVLHLSIEHPKMEPPIQMGLKVARILSVKGKNVQVYRVETQVAKFPEKEQERFTRAIEPTPLIRYGFLSVGSEKEGKSKEQEPAVSPAPSPSPGEETQESDAV
ncbi:MAG: FHA domain-containing protein [Planctomycetes bacterium]|nr:FHA domain-containing protein [Planctomycetota bacterium]